MTTDNQASLENVGTKRVAMKNTIVHRYLKSNAKTPIRILHERTNNVEDPICLTTEDAYNLIERCARSRSFLLFNDNKAFLHTAEKRAMELSPYAVDDNFVATFIEEFGKPASVFIKMMQEEQKPLLCIDEAVANLACALMDARIQTIFLNTYWKDLPNGEERLKQSDIQFEALCSNKKIGRRTREAINRRKSGVIA